MPIDAGIFGNQANPSDRYIEDHKKLQTYVDALKTLDLRIVLTMGTFDLFHIGHSRYLNAARKLGDLLIVGVDSDEKVRKRKGENRPVVPHKERIEKLTYERAVDIVTIKKLEDPRWCLIKLVRPNTLQATIGTYTPEQVQELHEFCCEVVIQEPMATTSTSARLRNLVMSGADRITARLVNEIPSVVRSIYEDEKAKT